MLLASEEAVNKYNLKPRARIHHISARGDDPVMMLTGPIPATQYALEKTGLSIDDIDTVEINEAFAPVVLAWLKETKADPAKVNPSGGAIALGHPLGATGAKLFATMLNTLERTGRPLRPADHVRGRRHRQRHDHRAPLICTDYCPSTPPQAPACGDRCVGPGVRCPGHERFGDERGLDRRRRARRQRTHRGRQDRRSRASPARPPCVAESAHTWADTGNEVFLLIGTRKSMKPADAEHRLGVWPGGRTSGRCSPRSGCSAVGAVVCRSGTASPR